MKGMGKTSKLGETPKPPMDEDHEADGWMNTLIEAEKIKGHPEKMKRVHKRSGRHFKAIKNIQDLRDLYNSKAYLPKGGDGEEHD